MSVLFSRRCEYALQAVLYMARKPDGTMTSIRELTDELGIPYHFSAKILYKLSQTGLLRSMKGPSGGFALTAPASSTTLYAVVETIDGTEMINRCVMGFRECNSEHPCSLHERWSTLRESVLTMLTSETVAEHAVTMRRPEFDPPRHSRPAASAKNRESHA